MIGDVLIGWTEIGFTDRIATGVAREYDAWLKEPDGGMEMLVEVDAFAGTGSQQTGRGGVGDVEIGAINIGFEAVASDVQNVSELRFSRFGWVGDPTDARRPNVQYDPRLRDGLRNTRSMPYLPEQRRQSAQDIGRIALANADGDLDALPASTNIDGRRIRVKIGPRGAAYGTFKTVADGLGAGWEGAGDTVELRLRDRGLLLSNPIQANLYAGTGDEEGDATVAGQPKPLVFGKVRNVPATLIDPTNLIYQLHDGALASVDAVYDRALGLTASGTDVADYSALVNTSVPAGEYATATAAGVIKLGSSPDGQITADATGQQTSIDDIVLTILRSYAGEPESQIGVASITGFQATRPGVVGTFVGTDERPSIRAVLERLIGGLGGFHGYDRDGVFRIQRLRNPDRERPSLYLETADILRLRPGQVLVPRWRQRVGYRRNWTVQQSDIAAAVSDSRTQFVQNRQRVVRTSDTDVLDAHPDASDPDVLASPFDNEGPAQTLCDDLFALHGATGRQLAEVELWRVGYHAALGQVVNLPWPRATSQQRKTMIVIGIEERGPRVRLRLWG
jgi:hypothetical protein